MSVSSSPLLLKERRSAASLRWSPADRHVGSRPYACSEYRYMEKMLKRLTYSDATAGPAAIWHLSATDGLLGT